MLRKPLLFIIVALAVVTLSCGVTINIPVDEFKTGPTQTIDIDVAEPDAAVAELTLVFGAGELKISPGAAGRIVSGVAKYNLTDLKPDVTIDNERVKIETGDLEISGLPKFGDDVKNEWDLLLGSMEMDLMINSGAYQGNIELGGLSLRSLEVTDGAADVRMKFSEPNRIEMDTLRYATGASNVSLFGLANANFTAMVFRSGAGDYTLDFSGDLKRDAVVTVESGISRVVIIVPEGVSARVIFNGGLANVNASREWERSGDQYTLEGDGPDLIINVDMAAGSLELRTD
jgi:hypothetical protein